MCEIEKRYTILEEKLTNMQKIIDVGFKAWIEEETKEVFMKKYEDRKKEANEIYRTLLKKSD